MTILDRAGAWLAAAGLAAALSAAASAAEMPVLPPAQDVKQRPVVEMLPPGERRRSGGFSLADPALQRRREPPPPAGGIDFGQPGAGPRGLQLELADPARPR